jgi:hypothetical protein
VAPAPQSTSDAWFRLQRSMGNQAARQLLESAAGEPYEAEAERAADRVKGSAATGTGNGTNPVAERMGSRLSSISPRIQRAAKTNTDQREPKLPDAQGATLGLIVDDDAPIIGPGQMKLTAFFHLLEKDICATADAELAVVGRTAASCPYIEKWMAFYRTQSSQHLERVILKYAPEAAEATTARDYIRDVRSRVRRGVAIWAKTGRVTGIPPGVALVPASDSAGEKRTEDVGTGALRDASQGREVQLKGHEGAASPSATKAEAVQAQLGSGRALEGGVRTSMESAFGRSLSNVRVHDDHAAGAISTELNARAFTIGSDIAFSPGEYNPGTPVGDALIAHELAHVVQQGAAGRSDVQTRGDASDSHALEEDADISAVGAIASTWGGIKGQLKDVGRNAAPRLRSGLKLQRCTFAKAPTELKTAKAKAEWIKKAIDDNDTLTGPQIVKMFKSAATQQEFLEIQKYLDMDRVMKYLDAWDTIQVGAIGPVTGGQENLNQTRKDYIVDSANDYGLANAMVFTLFIFNTMYTDDMRVVLRKLADDRRMRSTILPMDPVVEVIKKRGINLDDYKDPDQGIRDFGRGVATNVGNLLSSSELNKSSIGQRFFNQKFDLPQEYQDVLSKIGEAQLEEALKPGNVILGTVDYVSFGIPGSVYGLVRGTIGGAIDLGKGNYEEAGGELTGAILLILSFVGAKAVARIRAPGPGAGLKGPAGAGQFVLQESKAVPKAVARLNAIVQLGADGEAAATALVNRLGENGVLEVGRYIQADSKAARFVYENGVEGAEALQKAKGNLAEATKLLPNVPKYQLPAATPPPPPSPAPPPVTQPVIPPKVPAPPKQVTPPPQRPAAPPQVVTRPADVAAGEAATTKPPVTAETPVDKVEAAKQEADAARQQAATAKQDADAAQKKATAGDHDPDTAKQDAETAQQKADAAKKDADVKATDAEKQKANVPSDTPEPAPAVDKAKRLQQVRAQKAANESLIKDLYEKIRGARERYYDAAAKLVKATDAERPALEAKRDRNGQSWQSWQKDYDDLVLRNRALAVEESQLAGATARPTTWQQAEQALRNQFQGLKKTFSTSFGDRQVDCYTPDRVAREAKFGQQGLSEGLDEHSIRLEIEKDKELLRSKQVDAVEWHFYENPETGTAGWSSPLGDALRDAGFRVIKHF